MTVAGDGGARAGGDAGTPAFCYRHPNRETLIRCTRCDRPICPDCMRPASVGFHCPDDVALAASRVREPRTAVGAALRESPPYVTGGLIAANVVVYLITGLQSVQGLAHPAAGHIDGLFDRWQLQPQAIHDQDRYYTILTSAFLHVNLLHIASNMLALFFLGPTLEQQLGRWRFGALYGLCALGGSAAIYAFGDPRVYTVGASGAVFGLFGVCLVLARRMHINVQSILMVIVINFVFTFSVPGISKLGHIGGFVTGLLCALALGGLPRRTERVPTRIQVAGLAGVFAVVVVVIAARSATF